MKKLVASLGIIFIILSSVVVYAAKDTAIENSGGNNLNVSNGNVASTKLIEQREHEIQTLEEYKDAYGSDTYGLAAYLLNRIRIFSIPFCFLGVAFSAIYQYVLGIRKLDVRDKGFAIMLSIITVFVICQILPLIFAIVVKGWRG